jgi:hypothetical protein
MHRLQWLLFLCPVISSGCFASSTASVAPYEVIMLAPTTGIATGATVNVHLEIHGTSQEEWGGWGAGPEVPTLSVDRVSCSPDCVATPSGGGYDVTATTAGPRSVELAFSTSDGKHSVRTAALDFRDATRIDARRGGTSPSGAVFAMLPGDGQFWTVSIADERGPLLGDHCQPEVSSTGAVEVEVVPCTDDLGISAITPGSGTVTMRYGSLVRTETITVIDPADIRQVELRAVGLPSDGGVDVDSVDGVLAPLQTPLVVSGCAGYRLVVPQLVTADGTVAYGGANLLRAIPSSIKLEPYGQVVALSFGETTTGTLRGNFGSSESTTLSTPFVVQPDPSCDP